MSAARLTDASEIALLGFGEVGQRLAEDLHAGGAAPPRAWDLAFADPQSAPSRALGTGRARRRASAEEAVAGAALVISAVTAEECVAAARSVAAALAEGAFFLDLNSVSPGTRRAAARVIGTGRGRYVEAAVMAPIAPLGIASPMLLGGPAAAAFLPWARRLGFAGSECYAASLGRASAAKLCRSVIIKGIEALLTEGLLAARHHGVEAVVLDSLSGLMPVGDWRTLSRYMISRSVLHGRRRAAEMREAVATVHEAGVEPWMSLACVERQDWAAGHAAGQAGGSLEELLDRLLEAARENRGVEAC